MTGHCDGSEGATRASMGPLCPARMLLPREFCGASDRSVMAGSGSSPAYPQLPPRCPSGRPVEGGVRRNAAGKLNSLSCVVCAGQDEGEHQLRYEVANPDSSWLWQAHLRDGDQAPNTCEENA